MGPKKLDILGCGIGGAGQITLSSNVILTSADTIFSLVAYPSFQEYLKAIARNSDDLMRFYRDGEDPGAVYQSIASAVLDPSGAWNHAAFVVEGNPRLYNRPVELVVEGGSSLGWEVNMHPSISALDTLLIDLDLSIEASGLQIFDAGRLVAFESEFTPTIPMILFQIAACSSRTFVNQDNQTSDLFRPLQEILLLKYPPDHPFVLTRTATDEAPKEKIATTILRFPEHARDISYDMSAYVPECVAK